jgi:Predicted transcriptional regulators
MFSGNLKILRKDKGLSQEVLAERLHVVRQTVSKWEKGLSIPDAEMLIRLAEELDTTVAELLGETVEAADTNTQNAISLQLEQLNAQLAEKNRRSRRIWKVISIILIAWLVFAVFVILFNVMGSMGYIKNSGSVEVVSIESASEAYTDLPIVMQIKEDTLSPTGASFVLHNGTNDDYGYGEAYILQRKIENEWEDVEIVMENYSFKGVGYILAAKQTDEIAIEWAWLYGELSAGDYLICKEVHRRTSSDAFDAYPVYVAFSITR